MTRSEKSSSPQKTEERYSRSHTWQTNLVILGGPLLIITEDDTWSQFRKSSCQAEIGGGREGSAKESKITKRREDSTRGTIAIVNGSSSPSHQCISHPVTVKDTCAWCRCNIRFSFCEKKEIRKITFHKSFSLNPETFSVPRNWQEGTREDWEGD